MKPVKGWAVLINGELYLRLARDGHYSQTIARELQLLSNRQDAERSGLDCVEVEIREVKPRKGKKS